MGTGTRIEWCDATWNPITGCSPISTGCENCYAKRMATRLRGRFGYPEDAPFRVAFHPERLNEPWRWKKHRRVFVNSMGDIFHGDVLTEWLDDVLNVIFECPEHTFMILTKRANRIEEKLYSVTAENPCRFLGGGDYIPNLWLGITAENQEMLDYRWPFLARTPTAVRFVSLEPLLSGIDFVRATGNTAFDGDGDFRPDRVFDWCIVGAETGPGKRPMNLDWARSVRDQCVQAGVPFFFKRDSDGNHELDGQVWEQFPEARP